MSNGIPEVSEEVIDAGCGYSIKRIPKVGDRVIIMDLLPGTVCSEVFSYKNTKGANALGILVQMDVFHKIMDGVVISCVAARLEVIKFI